MENQENSARVEVIPTPEEAAEIEAVMKHFGQDGLAGVCRLINEQLTTLHQRAQSLIGLASVVITVTGFSGRIIADTNLLAQSLIVLALIFVGLGAAFTLMRVMPIRWVTSYLHLPPREWLLVALRRRTRKSQALRVAGMLMVIGMLLYLAAIAMMLLNPEATELTRVR